MSARRQERPYQAAGLIDLEAEEAEPTPLPQPEPDTAEEPAAPDEPDPPEEFSPDTFQLMDEAPHDGSMLQVKFDPDADDDRAVFAVWRSTTMFDREARKWRRIGYWADPITKRQLPAEPIVYRLASAAPILGVLVG